MEKIQKETIKSDGVVVQIRRRQKMAPSDARKLVEYVEQHPELLTGVVISKNISKEVIQILDSAEIEYISCVGSDEKDIIRCEEKLKKLLRERRDRRNKLNECDKKGLIRDKVIGGSLNYDSRCTIVPDPTPHDNEVENEVQPTPDSEHQFTVKTVDLNMDDNNQMGYDIHVVHKKIKIKHIKKYKKMSQAKPNTIIGLVCAGGISDKAWWNLKLISIEVIVPKNTSPIEIDRCKNLLIEHICEKISNNSGSQKSQNFELPEIDKDLYSILYNSFVETMRVTLDEVGMLTQSIEFIRASVRTAMSCAAKIHIKLLRFMFDNHPNIVAYYTHSDYLTEWLLGNKPSFDTSRVNFDVTINGYTLDTNKDIQDWEITCDVILTVFVNGDPVDSMNRTINCKLIDTKNSNGFVKSSYSFI